MEIARKAEKRSGCHRKNRKRSVHKPSFVFPKRLSEADEMFLEIIFEVLDDEAALLSKRKPGRF